MAMGAMADPLSVGKTATQNDRGASPKARPSENDLRFRCYQVPALQPPPPPAGVQVLVTVDPLLA